MRLMFFTKKFVFTALVLFAAFAIFSTPTFAKDKLVAGGCVTEYYLMQDLTEKFNSDDLNIDIRKTGNMRGFMMFNKGALDFAFLSMPHMMMAKNMNMPADKVAHMKSIEIAKEPILVVVNTDVDVNNLSKDQVTAIYNGEITNWKEVGGSDRPIKAATLNQEAQSGLWAAFKKVTIGMMNDFTGELIDLKGPEASSHFLSRTSGGITYVGLSTFDPAVSKPLAINGVEPTMENFKNGTYPLVAKYFLTFNKENPGRVTEFLDFIFSEEGKKVVQQRMIPVGKPTYAAK